MQLRATRLTATASAVKRAIQAFSPAQLFGTGAPGVWYDPSDMSTLFQDSAGTTPVTAVEQPVGLMLDKSRGLVLGSDVAVNGDFATDTDWTKTTGWTISGGSANFSGSNDKQLTQTTLVSGKNYFYTVTATNVSGGKFCVWDSGTAAFKFFEGWTGTQTFTGIIRSGTNTLAIYASAGSFSIDNISVKELPGNHAFQATSASRPVLSARYNQLITTDNLSNADYAPFQVTKSVGTVTSPLGDLTATALRETTSTSIHILDGTPAFSVVSGVTYLAKISVQAAGRTRVVINAGSGWNTLGSTLVAYYDLSTVSVDNVAVGVTATITARSGGWYDLTYAVVANTTGALAKFYFGLVSTGTTIIYAGDVTKGVNVWGASLVPANQSTLPYQRVNTATDYATTGFLPYLKFDGVDDSLSTNSISFTSTDKMSVFAGVRKLGTSTAVIFETSTSSPFNDGTFGVFGPDSANQYTFLSRGSASAIAATTSSLFAAPITNVVTGLGDISGDLAILRVNGSQVAQSTADQGTGNFGNYPLYLGRRGGSSLPFNGQLYGLIIVGKAVTVGELSSTEKFVAGKTGVIL